MFDRSNIVIQFIYTMCNYTCSFIVKTIRIIAMNIILIIKIIIIMIIIITIKS